VDAALSFANSGAWVDASSRGYRLSLGGG